MPHLLRYKIYVKHPKGYIGHFMQILEVLNDIRNLCETLKMAVNCNRASTIDVQDSGVFELHVPWSSSN